MEHDNSLRRKHVKEKVSAVEKAMKKHESKESIYNEHKEHEMRGRKIKHVHGKDCGENCDK